MKILTHILGASLLFVQGCSQRQMAAVAVPDVVSPVEAQPDEVIFPPDSPKLAQIGVESVENRLIDVGWFDAPGRVEANPNWRSEVRLPIVGRIASVDVKMGDSVKRGQSLATVESHEVDAAVSGYLQAEAGLVQAGAAVTQAKSAAAKARKDLDRERDMFEHGAAAHKAVLNAEAILQQTLGIVDQANAALEQATAILQQARRKLHLMNLSASSFGQNVTVASPLSGKVLDISVVKGEFRNDLTYPLMTIADLSSVWITADVPETRIRSIRNGLPATITLQAFPDEIQHGQVARISDLVDPVSRAVKVHIALANPQGRFRPEMFATVRFAERRQTLPTVPAAAVLSQEGDHSVWLEMNPGHFRRIPVSITPSTDGRVAVLDGVSASDRVVTRGVLLLQGS